MVEAANVRDAKSFIKSNKIDLLLLDIEMPNGSGFDLLESIKENIDLKIIFVTAYHEYALKAFRYSAVDYLLKPINPDDLQAAVKKIKPGADFDSPEKIESLIENIQKRGERFNKIALASMEGLQFVSLDEIMYCESQDNYTQFF